MGEIPSAFVAVGGVRRDANRRMGSRPEKSKQIMSLKNCRIIDLPKVADPRGNLTFLEGTKHIPFDIKRVFYLYDVPGGAERGGHAR